MADSIANDSKNFTFDDVRFDQDLLASIGAFGIRLPDGTRRVLPRDGASTESLLSGTEPLFPEGGFIPIDLVPGTEWPFETDFGNSTGGAGARAVLSGLTLGGDAGGIEITDSVEFNEIAKLMLMGGSANHETVARMIAEKIGDGYQPGEEIRNIFVTVLPDGDYQIDFQHAHIGSDFTGPVVYRDDYSVVLDFDYEGLESAPTAPTLSGTTVTENDRGARVGSVLSTDADVDPITYTVDDDRFEIVDGSLKLKTGVGLDYEATPTVTLTITATDDTGLATSETFTISIEDVDQEPPQPPTLSASTVAENTPGAVIGTLSSQDDNGDPITYTVNDDRFEVVGDQLKLKDGVQLDHEAEPSIRMTVTANDGTGFIGNSIIDITVTDVVEDPDAGTEFTATVTNEAGATVLTSDTEGASGYAAAEGIAQEIVTTQYQPEGLITANDVFIEFRRDAEVASIVDNGDGTYTATVTQQFGREYRNAGGGQSYTNTDTYTVRLDEQQPPGAVTYDVTATGSGFEATVQGSTPAEAQEQAVQELLEYETDILEFNLLDFVSAEVQSQTVMPDGSVTVVISYQERVGQEDGPDRIVEGTKNVTLHFDEVAQADDGVEVAAHGRYLRDDTTSDVGDGIINGDTTEERIEDLEAESALLIWDAIVQQSGGEVPNSTAEGWLMVTLGALRETAGVSEADAALLTPEVIEQFITANVSADGTVADTIDYSMVPPALVIWVRDSVEIGGKLFFSAQQNLSGANADIPEGSFVLPSADASGAATSSFLRALQSDVTGDSTSAFVTDGNKWQEFLSSGITSSDEIVHGDISDESIVNDSLTKAILWVGKDVIGELGDDWTGPTAEEFDNASFVDDHKVFSVSYTRNGQAHSGLFTEAEFKTLVQDHKDGNIHINSGAATSRAEVQSGPPGGPINLDNPIPTEVNYTITYVDEQGDFQTETLTVSEYDKKFADHNAGKIAITTSHVTSPTSVRMFWAQRALATYDATRTPTYDTNGQLTSGASTEVRVARAFNAIYEHSTDPDGANVLESTDTFGPFRRTGTRLNPLLDFSDVSTAVTGTDSEATAAFYEQLGKIDSNPGDESTGVGRIFGSWQGGTEITSVAGQFAKARGNHPDHDSFTRVGNGDHAETAGDNILAALIARGRATDDTPPEDTLGYSLSRETATDIRNNRWDLIFVAGLEVAAVVLTAGGALYAASAEAAVAGAAGGVEFEAVASVAARETFATTGLRLSAKTGIVGTEALNNFIAASNATGSSVIPFLTSAAADTGALLAYGGLLAAGDIATQPDPLAVVDPEQAGSLEEPVVQPGRSTVAIYRGDGAGGFTLVREFDADTPATRVGAAGQNLTEQLSAAQIAFQVTEFVAGRADSSGDADGPETPAEILTAFYEFIGQPASEVVPGGTFVTREDLGISDDTEVHIDIGGEGRVQTQFVNSGFDGAINIQGATGGLGDGTSQTQSPFDPIPNLVRVDSFDDDFPFGEGFADTITLQNAPLTDNNVDQIARMINKDGGTISLWIDSEEWRENIEELAERVGGEIIWEDTDEFGESSLFSKVTIKIPEQRTSEDTDVLMALEYLNTQTAGTDTPDIVDVLQWLDQDTTEVIEPLVGASADLEVQEYLLMLERLALDTAAGIEAAAEQINTMSPAAGRDAILHLVDNYGPDVAPQVLAAMDPAAAGAILVFDQSLHLYNQTNRSAAEGPLAGPTELVELVLTLTVSDPTSAGEILSAAGSNDIEAGGHILQTMISAGISSDIAKSLIHADPLVAAELLNEALQVEQDATPDWTPETSKVLAVVTALWEAGLDQGQPEQGAAITAAFTLTQDVMSEQQEDTFLSTLGADFQAKVTEFATSTYKLFKEVYNDALAHKNMAGRLENAYKFFEKIFLNKEQAEKAGKDIVEDLLSGSTDTDPDPDTDNGPDGGGDIGPVDQLALTVASNFLSAIGGGQVQVLGVLTLRSPELPNILLEEVSTQTDNGLQNATTWETELVETGSVSVLGVNGDFEFVVDTLHDITGVDHDVITKMFSGKLSFEEGAEGGAHLVSDMMMEALSDPDHEFHDEALEVVDRIGRSAMNAHDWEPHEAELLQSNWDVARTGSNFLALASHLMMAGSAIQSFVSSVQHASASKKLTEQAAEWTIEDIKEMVPNYEEIVADMEIAYDLAVADFANSAEGQRTLADADLKFVDGSLRTISTDRELSDTEQQTKFDKYFRFDYAIPELNITFNNSDGSKADTAVQFRGFFTHSKTDADGNRYFGFRVRVLDQTVVGGNLPRVPAAGDVELFAVRDVVDLKIYDEGSEIREVKVEILDLARDVENAENALEKAEDVVDDLIVDIQEKNDEKTSLETKDLADTTALVDADQGTVNTRLGSVPASVSGAYNLVSAAFAERDRVYQDGASTDAEKQTADQGVTTALAGLNTAIEGTDTSVTTAQAEFDRVSTNTTSTPGMIDVAQTALDVAIDHQRNSTDLGVEVGALNESLEGRVDVYEQIAMLGVDIAALEVQKTTADGVVGTATTDLTTAETAETTQVPILEAELAAIDPDDEGSRLGPVLYQSNWGALGELTSRANFSTGVAQRLHNFFATDEDQILSPEEALGMVEDAEGVVTTLEGQRTVAAAEVTAASLDFGVQQGLLNGLEDRLPGADQAYDDAIDARDLAIDVIADVEGTEQYLKDALVTAIEEGDTALADEARAGLLEIAPDLVQARADLVTAKTAVITTGTAYRTLQLEITAQQGVVRLARTRLTDAETEVMRLSGEIAVAQLDVGATQEVLQIANEWEAGTTGLPSAGGIISRYSRPGLEAGIGGGINTTYNLTNLAEDNQAALFLADWAGAAVGAGTGYVAGLGLNWLLFSSTNAAGQTVDGVLADYQTVKDFLVGNGMINNAADFGSLIANILVRGQLDDPDKVSQAGIGFAWAAFKLRADIGNGNLFGGRGQLNWDFPSTELI